MTKRTRLFVAMAVGILVVGLGTGLLASYMGLQNFVLIGRNGPPELEYVPVDSHALAYANVREVMDSELRRKLLQLHSSGGDADRFREQTGINLETDVDQVVVSLGASDAMDRPLVLVRGRFDNTRIEGLVRQQGGSAEEYGGKRVLTHSQANMSVAFVEPGLVALGTAASVRRAIDTKTSGENVTRNDEIMRYVRDIDDGNAWGVAKFDALTGSRPLPPELLSQLPPISWFAASGYVNGGVRGAIRVEARDETSAQNLREVVQGFVALARLQMGQRAEFADLLNSLQLGGQGTTVSLGFSIPIELIDALSAFRAARPDGQRIEPGAAPQRVPLPPVL